MPSTSFKLHAPFIDRPNVVTSKKNYFRKLMKAYGKIEFTIFLILFITIIGLIFTHNFIDC